MLQTDIVYENLKYNGFVDVVWMIYKWLYMILLPLFFFKFMQQLIFLWAMKNFEKYQR